MQIRAKRREEPTHYYHQYPASFDEMLGWVQALFPKPRIVELFVKGYRRHRDGPAVNQFGFFDDYGALVEAARERSGKCEGVYSSLNPLTDDLDRRCSNSLAEAKRNSLASNKHVVRVLAASMRESHFGAW